VSGAGLVNWEVAERVAVKVARHEPLADSYHYTSLEPDFRRFTVEAERLVEQETGLRSLYGPARAKVSDRPEWIRANLASFQRLLRPFLERLGRNRPTGALASAGGMLAGAEIGALLGWMSTRVLGQYDMLVIENEASVDQDIVYYVGPNILAIEKLYGLPPAEFRLWLALHELTHRAQFTGVPWLRSHFLSLLDETLGGFEPDPKRFLDALRTAVRLLRAGERPLDGGVVELFATPAQKEVLQRVQGLMSVLEGHGDLVMGRAAAERIPSAGRFHQVLHQRRQTGGAVRMVLRLVGLEAKMRQYQDGEHFLERIEREGGAELVNRLWEGPEWLPTLSEIRAPDRWLSRVGDSRAAAS